MENFPQGGAKGRAVLVDTVDASDRTPTLERRSAPPTAEDPERPQRIRNGHVILPPERSAEHLAPPSDEVYAQPPISAAPPDGDLLTHYIVAAFRNAGARYLEDVLSAILNATPEELAATGDELLAEAEKTHRAVIVAIGDARIGKGGDDGM